MTKEEKKALVGMMNAFGGYITAYIATQSVMLAAQIASDTPEEDPDMTPQAIALDKMAEMFQRSMSEASALFIAGEDSPHGPLFDGGEEV